MYATIEKLRQIYRVYFTCGLSIFVHLREIVNLILFNAVGSPCAGLQRVWREAVKEKELKAGLRTHSLRRRWLTPMLPVKTGMLPVKTGMLPVKTAMLPVKTAMLPVKTGVLPVMSGCKCEGR